MLQNLINTALAGAGAVSTINKAISNKGKKQEAKVKEANSTDMREKALKSAQRQIEAIYSQNMAKRTRKEIVGSILKGVE